MRPVSHLDIDPDELAALIGPRGPVGASVAEFAAKVVDEVKEHGPLGFDQNGYRDIGQLRADMSVRGDFEETADGINLTVGTDPVNHRDGYHYAEAIHTGRGPINSERLMVFTQRGGNRARATHHVGPAVAQPFLFDAVNRANAGSETQYELNENPF